jgi:hypothetical protein
MVLSVGDGYGDDVYVFLVRARCARAPLGCDSTAVERGSPLGEGLRARRATSTALASELCDCARALTALVSTSMGRMHDGARRCCLEAITDLQLL